MNNTDKLLRLIKNGKEIPRIMPVGVRQRRWRLWQEDIKSLSDTVPEITHHTFSDDYRNIHQDISFLQHCLDTSLRAGQSEPVPPSPTPSDTESNGGDNRSAPALSQSEETSASSQSDKIRVFLSYLSQDKSLARIINQELMSLGVDRVEIFQAHDRIRSGTRWKGKIQKELQQSDWFLMIYTDPDRDWEWPIHEAVTFETLRMADGVGDNRLCCLHATDKCPRTLSEYQHHRVEVFEPQMGVDEETNRLYLERFYENESRVYQFLRSFVGYPGNRPLAGDSQALRVRLIESAHKIATAFRAAITEKVRKAIIYPPLLEIYVDAPEGEDSPSLQAQSRVSLNEKSRDIFRIGQDELPWGDFLRRYAKVKSDTDPLIWTQQLETAINTAAADGIPQANFAVLYSDYVNSFLRPMLTRQEILYSGRRKFYVALIEQPAMDFKRHRKLGVILAGLMLASRFRYEFLIEQTHELSRIRDASDFKFFGKESRQSIETIEAEASQHGLLNPDALIKAFTEKDRSRVENWFSRWFELRAILFDLFERPVIDTTGLDAARAEIRALLKELETINSEFLLKSIKRYAQLVNVDLDVLTLPDEEVNKLRSPTCRPH